MKNNDVVREKIIVTSALPYANGPIHFGHIAGAYLGADIYVRYKKMTGADIIYICGTDDHGVAITISAEAADRSPAEHVKIYHDVIKSIFDRMNIQFTYFSQTSNIANHELSRHFFSRLVEKNLIEEKETEQLFCEKCDRFLADRYITGACPHCGHVGARGDECGGCGKWLEPLELKDPKCKVCGAKPEVRNTRNWYLKLKDREEWLRKWLKEMETGEKTSLPWKKIVVQEIMGYLNRGLENRAITRDLTWGVKLPGDFDLPGKVLYVWFDAPIGYISFTQELSVMRDDPEMWREYWQNPECKLVHFIGKDNIPFHAMIFPIMLHGVEENYNLPHFVAGNAFLNLEGRQFSKSEGWYIDPLDFLNTYEVDSIRYYLCSDMPEHSDSEFKWDRFQQAHNSELTNIYANLVNRTLKFIATKLDGKIPALSAKYGRDDHDPEIMNEINSAPARVRELLDKFEFRAALVEVMNLARAGNQFFDRAAPWKSLSEDGEKCAHDLRICLGLIKTLSVISFPFIPGTAQRVWEMLGLPGSVSDTAWEDASSDIFKDASPLPEPQPLFKRIEDKQIVLEKKKLLGDAPAPEKKKDRKQQAVPAVKKNVAIDDFGKMDLRVGRILEAEPVQGSMKMLKLKVDIGVETRQIVAGIAKFYTPERLIGTNVIVIANLEPKTLMGLESQGMLLAAGGPDNIVILRPDGDAPPGARVS